MGFNYRDQDVVEPIDLSEYLKKNKDNPVFTGKYFDKLVDAASPTMKKAMLEMQKQMKKYNIGKQLAEYNSMLEKEGLAVKVVPGIKDSEINLVAYDPTVKGQVFDATGNYIDKKKEFSSVQHINLAWDDSVHAGHAGINGYLALLDQDNSSIIQLKHNEGELAAQLKILKGMTSANKKKDPAQRRDMVEVIKSSIGALRRKVDQTEGRSKETMTDKQAEFAATMSQAQDALKAEKINLTPLIDDLKFAYRISDEYENELQRIFYEVSLAKDRQEAVDVIRKKHKEFYNKGLRGRNKTGFVNIVAGIQEKGYKYNYGNTSETAFSTFTTSNDARNIVAGDSVLNDVQREQGRKDTHWINEAAKRIFKSGVLASKAGEARGVEYAGKVGDKKVLPVDAVVAVLETNDNKLANAGFTHTSVREGQSIISDDLASVVDTSSQEMSLDVTARMLANEYELVDKKVKKLRKEKEKLLEKGKDLSKEKQAALDELSKIADMDIGEDKRRKIVERLYQQRLEKSNAELMGDADVVKKADGSYHVSGEGNVRYYQGRRLVSSSGNIRSASINNNDVIEGLKVDTGDGKQMTAAQLGIQALIGEEKLDSRKYGQRLKQDLISTLVDAKANKRLQAFFDRLGEDAKGEGSDAKAASFFKKILSLDSDSEKVYITDDAEMVKDLFAQMDEEAQSYVLYYLDKLRADENVVKGNLGLGQVYGMEDGKLVRTKNERMVWADIGGDETPQYGSYSTEGAANLRTGAASVERAFGLGIAKMSAEDKARLAKEGKDPREVARSIYEQYDASKAAKETIEELGDRNFAAVEQMKKTMTDKNFSVKNLTGSNTTITIGKGEGYDIDFADLKREEMEDGEVVNMEDTLLGKAEEIAKQRAEQLGIDPDDIQIVIDTGTHFQDKVSYDNGKTYYGYGGKALFLDRGMNSKRGARQKINNLVPIVQEGDAEKIQEAMKGVVQREYDDVNHKDGAEFDRLMNKKMSHSIMGATLASNTAEIMSEEEYNSSKDEVKKRLSDIASFGIEISRETAKKYLNDFKPHSDAKLYSDKELKGMLKRFKLDKKEDIEKMSREEVIEKILDTITATDDENSRFAQAIRKGTLEHGLLGMSGRFPFMNGLDIDPTRHIYVGRDLATGKAIRVGAGLAKKENADYDGDKEVLRLQKLMKDQEIVFNAAAKTKEDVLRKMGWIAKAEADIANHTGKTYEDLSPDDRAIFKNGFGRGVSDKSISKIAAMAARENKGAVGVFSNFSTEIRNMMKNAGVDETQEFLGTEEEKTSAASSMFVRSFFEAMEQDLISSKKVINRMVALKAKDETGKLIDPSKMTEEERMSYYLSAVSDVKGISDKFFKQEVDFKELAQKLAEMGILDVKDGEIVMRNRVTQNAMLHIEQMEGGQKILKAMFGDSYKNWDETQDKTQYGMITLSGVERAFSNVAQAMHARDGVKYDGTVSGLINAARNHSNSPEKRQATGKDSAGYVISHQRPLTEEQARAFEEDAAVMREAGDAAVSASDSLAKSFQKIAEMLKDFSGTAAVAATPAYNTYKLAEKLNNQKSMTMPMSTTSILSAVLPSAAKEPYSDPNLINYITAHRNEEYLGYKSLDELKYAIGNPNDISAFAALRGHAVGERTQFLQAAGLWAKNGGDAEAAKLSGKELEQYITKNLDRYKTIAEQDKEVADFLKYRDSYLHARGAYEDAMNLIHGEHGLNDRTTFLAKNKMDSFADIIDRVADSQITSLNEFFAPEKMAKVNGKKTNVINEAGYMGYLDDSENAPQFVGRTDVAGLRDVAKTEEDGTVYHQNELSIVDQKTKFGKTLSTKDIAQQVMNAMAANAMIESVRAFEKDGGGGYEAWKDTAAAKTLFAKLKERGVTYDPKQYYDMLANANYAKAYIQMSDPSTGATRMYGIDTGDYTGGNLSARTIMRRISAALSAGTTSPELANAVKATVTKLAEQGVNIVDDSKTRTAKYAGKSDEEVAEAYNKVIKERYEILLDIKKVQYEISQLTADATKEERDALENKKKNLTEKILEKNADLQEIRDTKVQVSDDAEDDAKKKLAADYSEYVKGQQTQAMSEYMAANRRVIRLQQNIEERKIRSEKGGGTREQKALNALLNEQDEASIAEAKKIIDGRDWESAVGGADALAEANKQIALEAMTATASLSAMNAKVNPTLFDQLKNSVKGWFSGMMRGQIVWKILGKIQQSVARLVESAKQLDAVLVNLQIVTGGTRTDTKELITTYSHLAQQLSATTSEVASAANSWLRQGYSVSETTDLITASLHLSKLGMIDSANATAYLTSMLKGFKLEAGDAMDVVDKLTKVDMSAATSAGDIAEALRQFAATAQLSGLSLDESIAMATTIMDVSQKDASSTGNALKTMLSRYGNVKAGTYAGMNITGDQNETTEAINDIEKVLRKLGISLRASNLEFRDFDDILDDIAEKWSTLDSVSKNAIATAMAGTRQRESFLVLMENYDKYQEFMETAQNAEGTAAEKYKAYEDSLEASQKKLSAAWEELASKTEVVDFLKQVNNIMATLVKHLPIIANTFLRMFSGKAAVNAIAVLGRTRFLKDVGSVGIKQSLSNFASNHFGPARGWRGEGEAGAGVIGSQIRNGTYPILDTLRQIYSKMPGKTDEKTANKPGKDKQKPSSDSDELGKDELSRKAFREKERSDYIKSAVGDRPSYEATPEPTIGKTRLSDIKKRKNGRYYGKGRNGAISKKDYDDLVKRKKEWEKANREAEKAQKKYNKDAAAAGKEYDRLEKKTADAIKKESDIKKAQAKGKSAIQAAGSGLMGFLTADTSDSHLNQFTGEWDTRETTDKSVKAMKRANTGVATAIGTYFGGEAGGAMAGFAADYLNRVLGQMFASERDANAKADRFGAANKKIEQVSELKTAVSDVVTLAGKDALTASDYSSLVKAQDSLRDTLTKSENAGLKDEFVKYANQFLAGQNEGNMYAAKSFDELTNLADMTDSERKKTAYALKVAQAKQADLAENAKYEQELDELNANLGEDYLDVSGANKRAKTAAISAASVGAVEGAGLGLLAGAVGGAGNPLAIAGGTLLGAVIGGMGGLLTASAISKQVKDDALYEWNSKTRDQQVAILEEMKETGNGDSKKLDEMISKIKSINDTIHKIQDKMNTQRAEEAILEMSVGKNADGTSKTLLDLSANALKDMGTDEIVERMAEYLESKFGGMANGESYYFTDSAGNRQIKDEGRNSILKALKSNEDIYGVVTGQSYTLADALGMSSGPTKTETLLNFANALHVSVDELESLGSAFGRFTLGDLTSSAEELSSKFASIQSSVLNIANGTQSWASTLQGVIKSYPDLIGYASDVYTLSLAMLGKMRDYASVQTDAQMSEVMSSEEYFDTFEEKLKKSLSEKEWEEFRNAQVNSFDSLQRYVANNSTELSKKLADAAKQELANVKLAADEQRSLLEKTISIKNSQIDKEVSNLNAQKEAMQKITSQREYENKLIEAKLRLESASKEKKRVWREGVGWVYEEDQSAIAEAKKNLDSITNEKKISAVDQRISQLGADKEYLSGILSASEETQQKAFLKAYEDANGVTTENVEDLGASINDNLKGIQTSADKKWDEWMKAYNAQKDTSVSQLKEDYSALSKAKEELEAARKTGDEKRIASAQENYNNALSSYQKTYNSGLDKGYWGSKDFESGGTFGDLGSSMSAAGKGASGWTKETPDQFLYRKGKDGRWSKFVFNPDKNEPISSNDWNKFYDKDGKTGVDLYNAEFGDSGAGDHMVYVNSDAKGMTETSIYNAARENTTATGFATWMGANYSKPTLGKIVKDGKWIRIVGNLVYELDNPVPVDADDVPEEVRKKGGAFKKGALNVGKAAASGSLWGSLIPSLVNEEGTEAIVTPQGTITALPSNSGVIPEDVTSNLWKLGGAAPDLLRALRQRSLSEIGGVARVDNSVDNSVNINTVEMSVSADGSFDVDNFVGQLKQVAALSKNNRV